MNSTSAILEGFGYSEEEALREFALLHASQKYAEFALEDEFFQKKYGMTFSEFERNISSSDEERFEMEDDYLAWKFAYEGMEYCKKQLESLKTIQ
jgi:hypothetical protein